MASDDNTILRRFEALSASNISDALKVVAGAGGVLGSLAPLGSCTRMCGRALPVLCVFRPEGDADPEKYGAASIPAAVGAGEILVLENAGRPAAVFGLVAAHAISMQRGAGIVVNGGVRDVEAIDEIGLPVFGGHAAIVSAYGTVEREFVSRVEIEGVEIAKGDIIIGERGGIVVVPMSRAAEVLRIAEQVSEADRNLIAGIRQGEKLADLWSRSERSSIATGQRGSTIRRR